MARVCVACLHLLLNTVAYCPYILPAIPSLGCAGRWDVEVSLTEGAAPRFGAFLPHGRVSTFDASAFGLPVPEAAMMDPQQRLLLELGWEALQAAAGSAAGGSGSSGAGSSSTGVFVGISTPDYADLKKAHSPIGVYSATGESARNTEHHGNGGGLQGGLLHYEL